MSTVFVNGAGTRAVARDRDAWSLFWADAAQSRCATGAPEIWQALMRHWWNFARSLPHGARVLDLGCGAGAVGRMLLAARDDLRVTGIDAARIPRSTLPHLELRSETDMEELPFDDGSFDAVVSQFGFEYSQTRETAGEMARVLHPGAELSLLVHHSQSAIVRANRERYGAVVAFLAPTMRASFCDGDAAGLGTQIALLVERYPDDALVAQLAQALPTRVGSPNALRVSTWESLEEALAPERSMADSLNACAVTPTQIDAWLEPLAVTCSLQPIAVLREADGTPIAWCTGGVRSG